MAERTGYTLYLTTDDIAQNSQVTPVNNINLANVSWNIDWDELFRYRQSEYKRCRLRFEMMTQLEQGTPVWNSTLGYLTCNLASSNSATTGVGTPLALLHYAYKRRYIPGTGAEGMAAQYLINTMETTGIDILIPRGRSVLNVQLINDDANTPFVLQNENYQLLFYFELYNEDE